MAQDKEKPVAATLTEEQRQSAMERFEVLRPHLEDHAPLAHAARQAGISIRTAERWLARYRQSGLIGLVRSTRNDAEARRLPDNLLAVGETPLRKTLHTAYQEITAAYRSSLRPRGAQLLLQRTSSATHHRRKAVK